MKRELNFNQAHKYFVWERGLIGSTPHLQTSSLKHCRLFAQLFFLATNRDSIMKWCECENIYARGP